MLAERRSKSARPEWRDPPAPRWPVAGGEAEKWAAHLVSSSG